MVANSSFIKPLAKQKTNHSISSFVFLSQDPEINASVSRYFKYVHNVIVTTIIHPSQFFHSTSNQVTKITALQTLIISNEMLVDEDICSLYPFWFAFGLRNNIQVYAFTMQSTNLSCNLLNWEDFLHLSWRNYFSQNIDFNNVPYFSNTRIHLTEIIKSHGDDSLYDLASGFHMNFSNALQYITRYKAISNKVPEKLFRDVIVPGIAQFKEFQEKESQYHSFLSLLPEAGHLFIPIKKLSSFLDKVKHFDSVEGNTLEAYIRLLRLIKTETSYIHSFFLCLESFMQRGFQ